MDVPYHFKLFGVEQSTGVYLTVVIVPYQPFFPCGIVADIPAVFPKEPCGRRSVGELDQFPLE
jgi:hypothetical protein